MQEKECTHSWKMIDIIPCFIVTEKCYHCNEVVTYSTTENNPPKDEYKDGDHYWNIMDIAQSIKFNLQCKKCNQIIKFEELQGLKMCNMCDTDCEIYKLFKTENSQRTYIYIAFGFLPLNKVKQLSEYQIKVLEDYFNERRKSSKSKIKIVSHKLVRNFENCYAETIKDVAMLELYENKNDGV